MKSASVIAASLLASPTFASVPILTPNTFIVQHIVDLDIPPDQAFRAFGKLPQWWDPQHTYSGNASNLRLKLKAGGCFCENMPRRGSIEHMRVSLVQPGERLVLTGALGPLLFQGVAGVMDITFEKSRRGTLVVMHYRVAGFAYSNADKNAPLVDKVLAEQVRRYVAFAEGPNP